MKINHFFRRIPDTFNNHPSMDCIMYSLHSAGDYVERVFALGSRSYIPLPSSGTYDISKWRTIGIYEDSGKCVDFRKTYDISHNLYGFDECLGDTRKSVLKSITNSNMGILDQKIWEF